MGNHGARSLSWVGVGSSVAVGFAVGVGVAADVHSAPMRLSRPRVLLRAALLAIGAGFMWWRSALAWRASRQLPGDPGVMQGRLALVFALMGLLALLTAGIALTALRTRKRVPTLRLRGPPGGAGAPPPGANPRRPGGLQGPGDRP